MAVGDTVGVVSVGLVVGVGLGVGVGVGLAIISARAARITMTTTAIAIPRLRGAAIITAFLTQRSEVVYMYL